MQAVIQFQYFTSAEEFFYGRQPWWTSMHKPHAEVILMIQTNMHSNKQTRLCRYLCVFWKYLTFTYATSALFSS